MSQIKFQYISRHGQAPTAILGLFSGNCFDDEGFMGNRNLSDAQRPIEAMLAVS